MLKVVDSHDLSEPLTPKNMKTFCQDRSHENQAKQPTCAESLAEMLKPYLQDSAPADQPSPSCVRAP